MKKYLIIFATVLIGGAFTWSCSQDDLNDGQPIYRYSAEQLAEIRTLAEKYDVTDVVYDTESEIGLPSVQEMEEAFKIVKSIRQSLSQPLELVDSTSSKVKYKTRTPMFRRSLPDDESYVYTGSSYITNSYTIATHVCWLIIEASWENANAWQQNVKVDYLLDCPPELSPINEEKGWKWHGATGLELMYSCDLEIRNDHYTSTLYNAIDYHGHITIHQGD